MEKIVKLGKNRIGQGQPCYIICEGGVTNYGRIDLAKKQVDAAVAAGCDTVKFQACVTEKLVSKKVSKRLERELGYNWFDRMKYKEFSFSQIKELFDYARSKKIFAFATAHDDDSLEFLDKNMKQPFFKIGSGEAHNFEFLKNVASRGKPVIISFGIQTNEEVVKAIEVLKKYGTGEIIALHCVSIYPTPYEHANLTRMFELEKMLGVPVGVSDHSIGWHVPLAAVVLGASVVEKHLTFDKLDPRSLDNPGALLPEEFKLMVEQIRNVETAKKLVPEKERLDAIQVGRNWAGQAMVAKFDLQPGTILTKDMVAFKRPGKGGLPPSLIESILGKKVDKFIEEDEQILLGNII